MRTDLDGDGDVPHVQPHGLTVGAELVLEERPDAGYGGGQELRLAVSQSHVHEGGTVQSSGALSGRWARFRSHANGCGAPTARLLVGPT